MSDKLYNILKWGSLIGIPAIGTLYFTLSQIWGLPYGEQIVGTLAAIETCIGGLLGVTSNRYHKSHGGGTGSDG